MVPALQGITTTKGAGGQRQPVTEPDGSDGPWVSDVEPPDPGAATVVAALRVRRNAVVGYGLATAATVALLSGATGLPVRQYPLHLAAALGFVLAFTLGTLLTVLFVAATGVRLARSL